MKSFFLPLLFISSFSFSQPKEIINIANQSSKKDLKTSLYYLASKELNGRLSGTKGDTLASLFVAKWFKKNNVVPAFANKSYYQAVPLRKLVPLQSSLEIDGNSYLPNVDWQTTTPVLNADLKNLPVLFANYGDDADLENLDVKGKAVLFLNGSSTGKTAAQKLSLLRQKGALLAIRSGEILPHEPSRDYIGSTFSETTLPYIILSQSLCNRLLETVTIGELEKKAKEPARGFQMNKTISLHILSKIENVVAPNVIGYVKGSDADAPCIIISAHHDHNGNNGKEIYYGAVDNASGTTAIMQMAALLDKAIKKGYRPKRTILFASYTGEEEGLLGSYYYADHPVFPIEKTYAVLNIDMMGRVDTFYSGRRADSNYAYILVKDSLNRGLRNALYKANDAVQLKLDTYYEQPQSMTRRLRGSDQFPLYLKGVPFLRIDCGFSKDYHKPTDTPDKINYDLLNKQVQLAFLTLWNLANE